jgi:molecular chaperone DnaK
LLAANLPAEVQQVAVVHCGGGSTDVTLAERDRTGYRVLATQGDALLGGDDFAWTIAEQLNTRFRQTAQIDVFAADRSGAAAYGLRTAAEAALNQLSLAPEMTLTIDHGGGFGRDLVTILQPSMVSGWLQSLLDAVGRLCQQALAAARCRPDRIDAVVLTGEWAFLPDLRRTIAQVFERPVADLQTGQAAVRPVYGAALAAANRAGTIWDVTPYPLGINCYYGEVERFSPIIAANTPIPTPSIGQPGAFTENYNTRYPDQTSVKLDILQYRGAQDPNPTGRTPVLPNDCELLGTWNFDGLRPKRGKHAPFTVTFAVDEDGILHLYARETATGHSLEADVDRGIG